jgi:translation initiation factor 5
MEKVKIGKEGKNTIFENLKQIGQDLNRDPKDILNFLKKTNGISFTYEMKTGKGTTSKGLTYVELQNQIYDYIELYVLCPKCKNPETLLNGDKKIKQCNACGYLIK